MLTSAYGRITRTDIVRVPAPLLRRHPCAQPIEMGDQGFTLKPWVIGPADVPIVTDRARLIELPELGVLSVAARE